MRKWIVEIEETVVRTVSVGVAAFTEKGARKKALARQVDSSNVNNHTTEIIDRKIVMVRRGL
jgi:hypothetical protein